MVPLVRNGWPLLCWLPDETLYGLAARHHRFWGCTLSSQTAQALFEVPRASSHHDLPAGLDSFVRRTGGAFGTAAEIATQRTLLQFYQPFASKEVVVDALEAMTSATVLHLKFRLGLVTGSFGAFHPLKACPQCMSLDLATYGWSYWHREHQYPGVWICTMHGRPLLVAYQVKRFDWLQPSSTKFFEAPVLNAKQEGSLMRLAHLIVGLMRRPWEASELEPAVLQKVLRKGLTKLEYCSQSGRLNVPLATRQFADFCHGLCAVREFYGVAETSGQAEAQLKQMLRPARRRLHPLRWLLGFSWLYADADELLDSWAQAKASDEVPEREVRLRRQRFVRDCQARRQEWLELLKASESVHDSSVSRSRPALYLWLHRNDRAWLTSHQPDASTNNRTGGRRVNWVQRDVALALLVTNRLNSALDHPMRVFKEWQIFEAVPELHRKLPPADRMPRTHAVIARARLGWRRCDNLES